MKLQLDCLKNELDKLQRIYGNSKLHAIYGAGCIKNPKYLLLFMNPTSKNIASFSKWTGLRAQWIGIKNIWKLFYSIGILDNDDFIKIKNGSKDIWTNQFVIDLYTKLSKKSVYITNLAKCTQDNAHNISDKVFKIYLENTLKEIEIINPQNIISFGNQVSSILLGKKTKVSDYVKKEKEVLKIHNKNFIVYPSYYPVGQGMRNIKKVIKRLKNILN